MKLKPCNCPAHGLKPGERLFRGGLEPGTVPLEIIDTCRIAAPRLTAASRNLKKESKKRSTVMDIDTDTKLRLLELAKGIAAEDGLIHISSQTATQVVESAKVLEGYLKETEE